MTYFTNFIYSTICRIDHKVDWSSGETFVLAPSTQTEDPPHQLEEEEERISHWSGKNHSGHSNTTTSSW